MARRMDSAEMASNATNEKFRLPWSLMQAVYGEEVYNTEMASLIMRSEIAIGPLEYDTVNGGICFFHGAIDRKESEARILQRSCKGAFLVRVDARQNHALAAMSNAQQIIHLPFKKVSGGVVLGQSEKVFPTISQLLIASYGRELQDTGVSLAVPLPAHDVGSQLLTERADLDTDASHYMILDPFETVDPDSLPKMEPDSVMERVAVRCASQVDEDDGEGFDHPGYTPLDTSDTASAGAGSMYDSVPPHDDAQGFAHSFQAPGVISKEGGGYGAGYGDAGGEDEEEEALPDLPPAASPFASSAAADAAALEMQNRYSVMSVGGAEEGESAVGYTPQNIADIDAQYRAIEPDEVVMQGEAHQAGAHDAGYMGVDPEWLAEQWGLMSGQPWFRGNEGRDEALVHLKGTPPGSFLVRVSQSRPGHFAVSVAMTKTQIEHMLIYPSFADPDVGHSAPGNTRYRLMREGKMLFNTVPKLCAYYIGHAYYEDKYYLRGDVVPETQPGGYLQMDPD